MKISPEEARVAELVSDLDDDIAACRAWGHEWPSRKLRPGRKLPRGFVPRLQRDGYVEVTETCLNGCGKQRRRLMLPGGIYDRGSRLTYTNPQHWKVIPVDQKVTRTDIQVEVFRRVHEALMTAAKANPQTREQDDDSA